MSISSQTVTSVAGGQVSDELLRRRIRLIPWVIVVGNLLFAATDPWLNAAVLREVWLIKLGVIGVQSAALVWLRGRVSRRGAIAVGLACMAVGVAGGAVSGALVRDPFTTPLLCTSAALVTGAVVPWGAAAQSVAAALTLIGGALTTWLVVGLPVAGEPIVGMAVIAALSVYIAREMAGQRAAEARATLALHRHQAELAHVLRVSAMGEMGAQLAHELTQPLGAIANYAAGCRRRLEAAPVQAAELIDAVDRIGREALRAGSIIRRMREFLRKVEPQRGAVDVNRLVREVVELLDGEVRAGGVTVELLLDEDLPEIEANGVEVEQVLVNLARNAIEAMQDGSAPARLTIETRHRAAEAVEVIVRDSGPGLSRGDDDSIFEPFFTTKSKGLCLGLAISRTIVELHGGTLAASSASTGATFRFTLPVRSPGLVAIAAEAVRRPGGESAGVSSSS